MKDQNLIIPFFIPHAGCPFTCVFCNQWEISGQEATARPEEIAEKTYLYIRYCKKTPKNIEVAYFGGSFTGLPQEEQEDYLKSAAKLREAGVINGIRLSTRPDYLDEETVRRLYEYGVTTIELGVQSLVRDVLEKACRGHTPEDTYRATAYIRKYPFKLVYQLMLGLPGDTGATACLTAQKTVEARPDYVRIYPTVVLKGTVLEEWYRRGDYRPLSLEEAVVLASGWLATFSLYDIPVIRLGLQATENLNYERDLVAGPYHPAFGELVKSRLLFNQLSELCEKWRHKIEGQEIVFLCHPGDVSALIGQKQGNLVAFKKVFGLSKVTVMSDQSIPRGDVGLQGEIKTVYCRRQEFLKKYRINNMNLTGKDGSRCT